MVSEADAEGGASDSTNGGNHQQAGRRLSDPLESARLHEWLITQGHRDSDLWSYSPDKLKMLARLAQERSDRDEARSDFRQLVVLRAIKALQSGKDEGRKSYDTLMRSLAKRAGINLDSESESDKALRIVHRRLKKLTHHNGSRR